jgi:hypothetical protein
MYFIWEVKGSTGKNVGEGDKEEILQKRSTVEQAITLST